MPLTRKGDRGSGFHRHPRTLVRFLTPTLHLCISFLLHVFAFLLSLTSSCLSPSAQPFFGPFLFSWDIYLYQVSGVLLLGEAQGRGNVLEIHFSNPLLTRRLDDCCWEFNLWLHFPSSRCTSAVTCDCVSPPVIEPAVQRWFNYSAACKFCQHVWVVKDSWWQQGIVMRPDAEQQRKAYSSCWGWVMLLWEKVNPTHSCSATDVTVDTSAPVPIRPE